MIHKTNFSEKNEYIYLPYYNVKQRRLEINRFLFSKDFEAQRLQEVNVYIRSTLAGCILTLACTKSLGHSHQTGKIKEQHTVLYDQNRMWYGLQRTL